MKPLWRRPSLQEVQPNGKAAQFVANQKMATFFLSLLGSTGDGFEEGDLLAISEAEDAEPGDYVVWWYGSKPTQALARVAENLCLEPVSGFPTPRKQGRRLPRVRGVVVGRLRRAGPAHTGSSQEVRP